MMLCAGGRRATAEDAVLAVADAALSQGAAPRFELDEMRRAIG
jgi:hypothetical protein